MVSCTGSLSPCCGQCHEECPPCMMGVQSPRSECESRCSSHLQQTLWTMMRHCECWLLHRDHVSEQPWSCNNDDMMVTDKITLLLGYHDYNSDSNIPLSTPVSRHWESNNCWYVDEAHVMLYKSVNDFLFLSTTNVCYNVAVLCNCNHTRHMLTILWLSIYLNLYFKSWTSVLLFWLVVE